MPDLGLFTGLLGGFNKAAAANRQLQRDEEDKQADRETKILSSLVGSDDPELSAAAISAMAEIAGGAPRPKGGYLQRIVGGGGAAVHPALKPVLDLLHTPGALDVLMGRAQGTGGATAPASPPGGAAGTTPAQAGGPPVVAPPVPGTQPASIPDKPFVAGGPPSVSAIGQPTGVTGGPPSVLPRQGMYTPGFNRTAFLSPEEKQRQSLKLHAEGIELDLNSKVNAGLKVWDAQHPNASPEDRQAAHDQILEKELGTAPRWTNVPGTVTRDRVPANAVDVTGAPFDRTLGAPTDNFVLQQAGSRMRAIPTTGPKPTHTYRSASWPAGDPNGKPAWVEIQPDGTLKFIAYQAERDFTATVTHADGSQELVLVPARFTAGSNLPSGATGGPPVVRPPVQTPPAGGPPQIGAGATPGAQGVLTTKEAVPVDATPYSKRTYDKDFYVTLPTQGFDTTQRRRLMEDAQKRGWSVLDQNESAIVDDVSTSLENMDSIERAVAGKLPKDSLGRFLGEGLANKVSAVLQNDPALAAFGTWRSAAIRALRGMAGSKSFRMTQAEVDLAIKNDIPEITDTVGTALQKMNTVRLLLRHTTDNVLSRGIPPEAYQIAPGTKRAINGIWWAMPPDGGRPRNLGPVEK